MFLFTWNTDMRVNPLIVARTLLNQANIKTHSSCHLSSLYIFLWVDTIWFCFCEEFPYFVSALSKLSHVSLIDRWCYLSLTRKLVWPWVDESQENSRSTLIQSDPVSSPTRLIRPILLIEYGELTGKNLPVYLASQHVSFLADFKYNK